MLYKYFYHLLNFLNTYFEIFMGQSEFFIFKFGSKDIIWLFKINVMLS